MPVPLTCHILDTVSGKPAASVVCTVSHLTLNSDNDTAIIESESQFAIAKTNADGRVTQWIFKPDPSERSHLRELGVVETSTGKLEWQSLKPGIYKIRFHTGNYFKQKKEPSFFPFVDIVFEVSDTRHYHIPLLLSNYGYSTYRGS
ncbi:hypothetical protein KDRO_C03480 [Kluyveromyces lactis]|nr:hypothetical protein KDRO_C03480 [Kluyveromyces lactis]